MGRGGPAVARHHHHDERHVPVPLEPFARVFNGVSAGSSGTLAIGSLSVLTWNSTANSLFAVCDIDLTNGVGVISGFGAGSFSSTGGATGYSTATTSITVTSGTTFDAGSILVYGW